MFEFINIPCVIRYLVLHVSRSWMYMYVKYVEYKELRSLRELNSFLRFNRILSYDKYNIIL